MVTFELSEILKNTGLSSLDIVNELADKLSMQTSDYVSNTKNQTTGIYPTYGDSVAGLPASDLTAFFINDVQADIQAINNEYIPMIYSNTVWQLMIAAQILPLGWLFNTTKHAKYKYDLLYKSWNLIVNGKPGNPSIQPLHQYMTAFGLVARLIGGHKNADLVFFAIYDNPTNYNQLQKIINDNNIDNIVLMNESEYLKNLSNGLYYNFTVRFDKAISAYSGVVFRASTNLGAAIPTYTLTVGSANVVRIDKLATDKSSNPHLAFVNFKRGADVAVTVRIPETYKIHMVSLDGTTYFNGSVEMGKAGISIVDDLYQTTYVQKGVRYKVYNIILSGLMTDAKLYIGACNVQTDTSTAKSMISDKSSISISPSDLSLNIIFNRPFIYLDTTKIKVWAKKDDESEEELVSGITYVMGEGFYRERQALFTDSAIRDGRPPHNHPHNPHHNHHHDHHHEGQWDGNRPNPYVYYSGPKFENYQVTEPAMVSHSIPYGVLQFDSIIATFDNYLHYKYFRVEFEPEAMIAVFEAPGIMPTDVIPYIEDALFVNEYYDTAIDDDDEDGVNNDGDSDNNTTPDVMLGSNLGISYDEN